jgi:RHS repeat-associated protein
MEKTSDILLFELKGSVPFSVMGSFVYDAMGRRESKSIGGAATNFLYDGQNMEQELIGATPTANYLTGDNIDEVFSRSTSGGTQIYLSDNLGSQLALTSSAGAIQTSYTFEPFGNTTTTGTTSTNPLQYTGRENDGDGLYYNRARYYSPVYGRFISEDPLGVAGGINPYAYVLENPISGYDPLGLIDINLIVPVNDMPILEAAAHAGDEATIDSIPNGGKYVDAQQIVSPPNTITIAAEGSPNGWLVNPNATDYQHEYYTAQQIANMITNIPGYNGKTIMIFACDAGAVSGANSFAQQLANITGAIVEAPDSFIIPDYLGGYTFPSSGGAWVPYYPSN